MSELTQSSAPRRFIGCQLLGSSQLVLGVILAVLCIAISIAAPQFYSEAN
ncbi:MAG: ABC transporter permease, partial [Mesorhizobium sp.]